ncbi:MAG TPA: hypothetical protein PKG52_11390 [bacterium]|nr:hypothetical protein [bacterium]HPS29771.1 hypothetical protein [bacterium]
MQDNQSYDEIQSKTVLLEDNDGINDMLSALNTGRAALDKKKKELERAKKIKNTAITIAVSIIAVALIAAIIIVFK